MARTAPRRHVLALVLDFDDTLAPDSVSGFLEELGEDPGEFFSSVQRLVREGWDPVPAQLHRMIAISRSDPERRITRERLRSYGKKLRPFPRTPTVLRQLRARARRSAAHASLEIYVVSAGLAEIVRACPLIREVDSAWATELAYDEAGEIAFPRMIMSHTEKTSYLYMIARGIDDRQKVARPFAVNATLGDDSLRIPLDQFIYVGDGLTDMPCFSIVTQRGGVVIGVRKPGSERKWGEVPQGPGKRQGRVSNLAPADYSAGSELVRSLELAVDAICARIALRARSEGDA